MRDTRIISAVDEDFGIGKDGEIPWRVPSDFQFFKSQTYGSTCVVGRKTFENIGMLGGRRFVVLTRDDSKEDEGPAEDEHGRLRSVKYVHCYEELYMNLMNTPRPIWICGGQSLYDHAIGRSKTVYLSHIPGTHDCDTFFPKNKLEEHYEPIAKVSADGFDMIRYVLNE